MTRAFGIVTYIPPAYKRVELNNFLWKLRRQTSKVFFNE